MRCPFCGHEDSQVKDSRPTEDGASIRRRRSCQECGARWTTFERVQLRELTVTKKGGKKEPFDREKLLRSLKLALQKRPVEEEQISIRSLMCALPRSIAISAKPRTSRSSSAP